MGRTTVLEKYQRLEAEGVWRPEPDAQRRDVIVSIGEATLLLSDLKEQVLTHWSLPAVTRLNPGARPAIYSPGADAADTLEIADPEMIEALSRVSKAIRRGQAHPGRVRFSAFAAVTAVLVAIFVFWFPGALSRYTASIIPDVARDAIGRDVLVQVRRVAGAPCASPSGARALLLLKERLFPEKERTIVILPSALAGTRHVPGGYLLVDHRLVEDENTPDALARALLSENARFEAGDATERLLGDLGVRSALMLLTTGHIPEEAVARYAAEMVATPSQSDAEVSTALALSPILSDSNWIALQQICEE